MNSSTIPQLREWAEHHAPRGYVQAVQVLDVLADYEQCNIISEGRLRDWHHEFCRAESAETEVVRLNARIAEQDAFIKQLSERLACASEALGRAAERGKVAFHLFAFDDYYPSGGASDFVATGDSIQEMMSRYATMRTESYCPGNAHITDAAMRIVAFWDDKAYKGRTGEPGWVIGSPQDPTGEPCQPPRAP